MAQKKKSTKLPSKGDKSKKTTAARTEPIATKPAKPPRSFMDEQAAEDEKDSVSEQLGKHVTQIWDIVREAELWTKAARSTASAPMKVSAAERVLILANDLQNECKDLLKFAKRRGLEK